MVKESQYYVQVESKNSGNYQYSDLIPFAQLDHIGAPIPCPPGTLYPFPLEPPAKRTAPEKQP